MNDGILPLENGAVQGIQEEYKDAFDFAKDLLRFGLVVIGSSPDGTGRVRHGKSRGVEWSTAHLALGLYAKTCKQFRSIILLCEYGLTKDASSITRNLFETVLAIEFLLRPRIRLTENGVALDKLKAPKGRQCPNCHHAIHAKPRPTLKRSSTNLRRVMYAASRALDREKEINAYINNALTDAASADKALKEAQMLVAVATKSLGPGWSERIKEKGYAGVSVRDLANSYKMLPYYLTMYAMQSSTVHGTDALDFIEVGDDPSKFKLDLGPSTDRLQTTLHLASGLFFGGMQTLNQRLRLGFEGHIGEWAKCLKRIGKAISRLDSPSV